MDPAVHAHSAASVGDEWGLSVGRVAASAPSL